MDNHRRLGFLLIGLLLLATLGARAAYRTRNSTTASAAPPPEAIAPAASPPAWRLSAPTTPAAPGSVRVGVAVDRTAVLKDGDGLVHVGVTLDTHGLAVRHAPSDIVVVLDRSGSMSGQKLEYGKQALRELIDRLADDDRLSLVTYDSSAQVRLPLGATARTNRSEWRREVDTIEPGGSTNLSAGLDLGIAEIERAHDAQHSTRLLLLSDGLANVGDISRAGLAARANRVTRMDAILGTVGIGSDFDESMMTMLARAGTGAFYYLAKLEILPELLNAELKTAAETYAQTGVVRFAPGVQVVVTSASTGLVNQKGGEFEIPVGGVYGEQTRTVWLTVKVPTYRIAEMNLGAVSFEYRRNSEAFRVEAAPLPRIACVSDEKEFDHRIAQKVWEQALLDEDINRSREALSDAIRSGRPADVDQAVASANTERKVAERLGNQRVLSELGALDKSAAEARVAQQAAPVARASAAKRSAAEGFARRNQGLYPKFDFSSTY